MKEGDMSVYPKKISEAEILSGLDHENIISYVEHFMEGNLLYIVIEYYRVCVTLLALRSYQLLSNNILKPEFY